MICPKCSTDCHDELRFCDFCGTDLTTQEENIPVIQVIEQSLPASDASVSSQTLQPISLHKTGRLWPPLVVLSILILAGSLIFFLLPGSASKQTPNPDGQIWFSIKNGELYFLEKYYTGSEELVIPSVVNGETVTAIADYGFSNSSSIVTVILPETLQHIGDYAFSGCDNLRGIYVPVSARSIGVCAFLNCDNLEAIYLSNGLETIGENALSSCDSLRYILFNGTYQQWIALYNGYFISDVELHTVDGVYHTSP